MKSMKLKISSYRLIGGPRPAVRAKIYAISLSDAVAAFVDIHGVPATNSETIEIDEEVWFSPQLVEHLVTLDRLSKAK